jgi:hypothetical protein
MKLDRVLAGGVLSKPTRRRNKARVLGLADSDLGWASGLGSGSCLVFYTYKKKKKKKVNAYEFFDNERLFCPLIVVDDIKSRKIIYVFCKVIYVIYNFQLLFYPCKILNYYFIYGHYYFMKFVIDCSCSGANWGGFPFFLHYFLHGGWNSKTSY